MPANLTVADSAPPIPSLLGHARRWADVALNPGETAMRRVALAGVVASGAIIMTGAAVRLSQSGLGCPDWPSCTARSIVASGVSGDPLIHRWVEFGNRLVTVAVMIIAAVVFLAALRYRQHGKARRDLIRLAAIQPAGVLAQAVLGGIVVLTSLNPVGVSFHFLLSMALVAATVALYVRVGTGRGRARPLVGLELRLLCYALLAVLFVMFAAGTVATGTGPLAGARSVPRYHLPLEGVTQMHADIGWLLAGLVVGLALCLQLTSAPRRAARLGWLLVGLIGLQGAIGYTQYFTGLPAGLVWVHVSDSVLVWVAALLLAFSLHDRAAGEPAGPAAASLADTGATRI